MSRQRASRRLLLPTCASAHPYFFVPRAGSRARLISSTIALIHSQIGCADRVIMVGVRDIPVSFRDFARSLISVSAIVRVMTRRT